jgi:precorrin-6B C5,15-methyltransferase / cobalt-precorrin-6B C5,C15-methyltransferase
MSKWLSIIGIGEEGIEALPPATRHLIDRADILVGGKRHLAMAGKDARPRITWATPLSLTVDEILSHKDKRVCVLATGDPLWFGIASSLVRRVRIDEMTIIPSPSAFSLACARLGWPLSEVDCLTLHGRPLTLLHSAIAPKVRLLILSHDHNTPEAVADILCDRGFGASKMSVFEHMGGGRERRVEATAEKWDVPDIADFNTIAVECIAGPNASLRPKTPGLPDVAFIHDGQLTKREVRAITLANLAPFAGALLWDVGAGCGSVAIEWIRSATGARAIAFERNEKRLQMINDNASALGTPFLEIVSGTAPACFENQPPPDAIFIGGGISVEGLFDHCWNILPSQGRLVANAVTLEGEARLNQLSLEHGGELTRIDISRAQPIGNYRGWRPFRLVTQWSITKP